MPDIDLRDNDFDNFHQKQHRRRPIKRVRNRKRKREKTTIYDYIASRVPADAHFVLNKYGKYRRARDERELSYQLRDFVRTFGEKGLSEIAKIHPDKDLLELHCNSCKSKSDMKNEQMSNFIKHKEIMEYNNASGKVAPQVPTDKDSSSKMLILGGFILMGIALIVKK